jgi:hypothetical protein
MYVDDFDQEKKEGSGRDEWRKNVQKEKRKKEVLEGPMTEEKEKGKEE